MLARGVPPPPLPRPCPLQTISYSSGNRCVFSFYFGSKSTTAATSCHKKASTLIKATAHLPSSLPFRSNQDDPDADAAPEDTTETLAAAPESTASPPPSTRAVSSRFQRLKASKIKVLAQKASLRKQQDQDKSPLKDATVDSSISSHSASRYTRKGHEPKMSPTSLTDKFQEKKNHHKREGSHMLPDKLVPHTPKNSGSKTIGGGLASRGWGHEGSSHSFKSEPTDRSLKQPKISAQTDFFSVKSFKDIGCSEFLIESLKRQAFFRPSHIQAMAFPPVIEGKSCIIADQSGSGKTLAYLLPLIQRLRQEELLGHGKPSLQGPQVLIMVPTSELGSQVLNNCRSISKYGVPFRSMVVTGGFRQRTQVENLEQGVDVLIATPGRFMFLINEGFLNLQNLRCAVLDEVDILLNDEDFEVSLQSLINSSSLNTQYLFVTATLPVDVYNKLVEAFPDCQVISGPGLHRLNARVEEILIDCSGKEEMEKTPETAFLNKKSALLQLVEQTPVAKTIVFCNKIESCRKVENILKRFDRKGSRARVLPFHAALSQELRLANMKEFMNSESGRDSFFLVCTDRASRGIDFAGVDHVVLFDFPRDPSEYVRRVGRTARGAGGKGRAFIFAVGKQVSLARRIIERNQKGRPLHDVPFARELTG